MLVSLFTDASYCNVKNVAGWGVWMKSNRGHVSGGGDLKGSINNSNVAEMKAICNGLCLGIKRGIIVAGDEVMIQTDSVMAIHYFCKTNKYKRRAGELYYAEVDAVIIFLNEFVEKHSIRVIWRHVKGHIKNGEKRNEVNRICDQLAKKGLITARSRQ